MSYLNDFKRMAVGRELPRLNEADDKTAKVKELIADVQATMQDLDRADREIPSFEGLLGGLMGVLPVDKFTKLRTALDGIAIGRAMDALDDARIALNVVLDPEYLSKANKPSKKRKVK